MLEADKTEPYRREHRLVCNRFGWRLRLGLIAGNLGLRAWCTWLKLSEPQEFSKANKVYLRCVKNISAVPGASKNQGCQ